MEETISLDEIFNLLKKKWLVIVSFIIAGIIVAFSVTTFVMTPQYKSSTQLITQTTTNDNKLNSEVINSNLMMINTYKDIIKSQVIVDKVRDDIASKYGYTLSSHEISDMIAVNQTQNSQMFTVSVTSPSPEESMHIANTVANVFQKEGTKITDTKKVTIASKAEINRAPVSPNKKVNIAIGAVLGLVLGILVALVTEFFDRTVKNEEFVSNNLDLPIIGNISMVDEVNVKATLKEQHIVLESDEMIFNLEEDMLSEEVLFDGLDLEKTIASSVSRGNVDFSEPRIPRERPLEEYEEELPSRKKNQSRKPNTKNRRHK